MKNANVSDIQIVPDAFAKAGAALKQINAGEKPDLSPCEAIAPTLKAIRTKEVFDTLDEPTRARIRSAAAATINRSFEHAENENKLLNFLNEALGMVRKPQLAPSERREKVGDFLIEVAAVA